MLAALAVEEGFAREELVTMLAHDTTLAARSIGTGFGASVALRSNHSPTRLLLRRWKLSVFGEAQGDVISGGGSGVNTMVGGSIAGGISAGVKVGPLTLLGEGVVGADITHAFADEGTDLMPGDPAIPGAVFAGYGATARIGGRVHALTLAVRREYRRSDSVPEAWTAEARWSKNWWFVGGRVMAYHDPFDSSDRGPTFVSLQIGVLWNMGDTAVRTFTTDAQHTR